MLEIPVELGPTLHAVADQRRHGGPVNRLVFTDLLPVFDPQTRGRGVKGVVITGNDIGHIAVGRVFQRPAVVPAA